MSSPVADPNHGFCRYTIGDVSVMALHDGISRRPLEGLIRNAAIEDVRAALAEYGLPTDALPVTFTPLLLQHDGEITLIDTGNGDSGTDTNGFMLENLKAAGFSPDDVSRVVISHFHGDHINGLRRRDGSEVFPNAHVLVPETEWRFWMEGGAVEAPSEAVAANCANVERVFGPMVGKVQTFRDGEAVLPCMTAVTAPGHTPGHCTFHLSSNGKEFLILSDIVNHPALFVRNPDWSPFFDLQPDIAIATRKRFLAMAADRHLQVAFFHAPFPATGFIERAQNGFRFLPVERL